MNWSELAKGGDFSKNRWSTLDMRLVFAQQ